MISMSQRIGELRQRKANETKYNEVKEEKIRRDVFFHETEPEMFAGATYDYRQDVERVLGEEPLLPVPEDEEAF